MFGVDLQHEFERIRNNIFTGVSGVYWLINPNKRSRITWKSGDIWIVYDINTKDYYCVPSKNQTHRGHKKRCEETLQKYTLNDFVEIETGDTVIDIGAFIGEFSIGAHELGTTIHALEPSPIPFYCLRRNTQTKNSIACYQTGIWKEDTTIGFSIAENQTENSALNIDTGEVTDDIIIEAKTIESFIKENDITNVDFLKVEGEGAEPEILEGSVDASINKIAVDAGAERYGEETVEPVIKILTENGYEVRESNAMVFARKL